MLAPNPEFQSRTHRGAAGGLGWVSIFRLGLVQAGIGAVVVLATSTLTRLMTVELALPALIPGALVALHYVVQLLRPRLGHGSDRGGARTPWIVGGMAATALGSTLAAAGVAVARGHFGLGLALLVPGFLLLGLGVGGCGTALLALLAERVAPARRGPAATLTWFMMMVGFIVSAGVAGALLKPYSPVRLVEVAAGVGVAALLLALAGVLGLEKTAITVQAAPRPREAAASPGFLAALREVWAEPHTRRFAGVVFLGMLAYAGQDLVLEPLAGAVFGYSPSASTQLMGLQRGGVLAGMAALGLLTGFAKDRAFASLDGWMAGGCAFAALALAALAFGAAHGAGFALQPCVFGLGVADGVFAVAAVGAMMAGVGDRTGQAGLRMGVWGAAQALAYAAGGLVATGALQAGRAFWSGAGPGFALTLTLQGALFAAAAVLMSRRAAAVARPASFKTSLRGSSR